MSINIPEARAQLHAARHKDAALADWARKYGARLLELVEATEKTKPTCGICNPKGDA